MNTLAIDIGNSNIVFGLFNNKKLLKVWRCETAKPKYPKTTAKIDKIIIASVVPAINNKLSAAIKTKYKVLPHFITINDFKGIKTALKNKNEIGADRIVDVFAALEIYGAPAIIIDFGTATTFDVIDTNGTYLGGVIAPGITLSRDSLHEKTAKLPRIDIKAPKNVIGNSTLEAMRSGIVYGYVAMVEGLLQRIISELPSPNSKTKIIATGGLAELICKHTDVVDTIDKDLTLKGLQMIGEII
ncbi:MAG: type III pantothenate kinase [Candidatus Margulisiibacteriota bacterium]